MYKEEEIEDSLEFCKGISFYETGTFPVPSDRVPYGNQKEKQENTIEKDVGKQNQEMVNNAAELVEELSPKDESFIKLLLLRIAEAVVCVSIAFVIATVINNYIGTHTKVDGNSMEVTLQNNDFLIIDKLSYLLNEPKRFDIIVFQHDEENYYIKRIIGMPGEKVQIIDGNIFINGSLLKEDYGCEKMEDSGLANKEITLKADEYFVLGDNRNHSNDSRFEAVGNIKRSLIVGKAVYRILPLEHLGKINE